MGNREIKFRVKAENLNNGKKYWVYVDLFKTDENPIASGYSYGNPIDRKTVGQLLEQRDAEGNEVYEGDILKNRDIEDFFYWVVVFHKGCPCIQLVTESGVLNRHYRITDENCFDRMKVFANIHDNPELLKPEKC